MDKRLLKDCTAITKETATARDLLSEYNATCSLLGNTTAVTLPEVLPPDSHFWDSSQPQPLPATPATISHVPLNLSWNVKKDLIQAYLLKSYVKKSCSYFPKKSKISLRIGLTKGGDRTATSHSD